MKTKADKAIKVALECMEIIRKQKHNSNLSGLSENATKKENEIIDVMKFISAIKNNKKGDDCVSRPKAGNLNRWNAGAKESYGKKMEVSN